MKVCKNCGINKDLSQYYKHKDMSDGHLNICKDCVKSRVAKRENELRKDPEWLEGERVRGRDKYHRLNYKDRSRELGKDPERAKKRRESRKKSMEKYPEKKSAHSKSSHIYKEGYEKHHWSYNEGDEKSVIFLKKEDHAKLHRVTVYDQERKMYRKCHNNELLDSIELVIEWLRVKCSVTDFEVYGTDNY